MVFGYGYQSNTNIEVLRGDDQRNVQFPSMPNQQKEYEEGEKYFDMMVTIHDGSLLYFLHKDDKDKPSKCYKLVQGNWEIHSILNEDRDCSSIVGTKNATYVFGGEGMRGSHNTFEYLPRGATKWIVGENEIPGKRFLEGCAIATKNGEDILLIAGNEIHSKRILSFNTKTHVFKELSTKLILDMCTWNQCMFIPGTNKIMIVGIEQEKCRKCRRTPGVRYSNTLILDLNDWSMTIASPMNIKRDAPGIGIITIDDQDRLAAIGGTTRRDNETCYFMNIELFNSSTGKWEISHIFPQKPLDLSSSQFFSVRQSDLSGLGLWLKWLKFKSVEINRRF